MTNTKNSIEKHQFKISIGVAITVVLFLIGLAINMTTWKTQMEDEHYRIHLQVTQLAEEQSKLILEVKEMEKDADNRDIQMAKIDTKLSNIETMLVEIKQEMKDYK